MNYYTILVLIGAMAFSIFIKNVFVYIFFTIIYTIVYYVAAEAYFKFNGSDFLSKHNNGAIEFLTAAILGWGIGRLIISS